MPKRKDPDTPSQPLSISTKRRKDLVQNATAIQQRSILEQSPTKKSQTSVENGVLTPRQRNKQVELEADESDSTSTPQQHGKTLFGTPGKQSANSKRTPSRSTKAKADNSAKRKSAQALLRASTNGEEDWDNSVALAQTILDEQSGNYANTLAATIEEDGVSTIEVNAATPTTPSKRGRPKGAKNRRSPTPEGDLPPEERYFFQNRAGPPKASSNIFTSLGLLSHDEYFTRMRDLKDHHIDERIYLEKLHTRAFPQWKFELERNFSICLYGYGSKRRLTSKFLEWLYPQLGSKPLVVVLNGFITRINIRNVLSTIGNALVAEDEEMKLVGQPHEMLDTILSHLTHHISHSKLFLLVNSIDSSRLRKTWIQSILSRLAAHPKVSFIATADTPNFPIMWNSTLKDQFRFVFHDATTFQPYDVEINVVDDVNDLLGRKNRRAGGKEGIGFVLKSLPENARNLYRVLLTEILIIANDGVIAGEDEDGENGRRGGPSTENVEEVGIEYRTLYQKALEEFICSSDMNFRFLLKEFHDHQMLISKRDTSGTEMLSVPLAKDEMEAVLEDLVIG